jgi:hypothetical protein
VALRTRKLAVPPKTDAEAEAWNDYRDSCQTIRSIEGPEAYGDALARYVEVERWAWARLTDELRSLDRVPGGRKLRAVAAVA